MTHSYTPPIDTETFKKRQALRRETHTQFPFFAPELRKLGSKISRGGNPLLLIAKETGLSKELVEKLAKISSPAFDRKNSLTHHKHDPSKFKSAFLQLMKKLGPERVPFFTEEENSKYILYFFIFVCDLSLQFNLNIDEQTNLVPLNYQKKLLVPLDVHYSPEIVTCHLFHHTIDRLLGTKGLSYFQNFEIRDTPQCKKFLFDQLFKGKDVFKIIQITKRWFKEKYTENRIGGYKEDEPIGRFYWTPLFPPMKTPTGFTIEFITNDSELEKSGADYEWRHDCSKGFSHFAKIIKPNQETVAVVRFVDFNGGTVLNVKGYSQGAPQEALDAAIWLRDAVNNGEIKIDWHRKKTENREIASQMKAIKLPVTLNKWLPYLANPNEQELLTPFIEEANRLLQLHRHQIKKDSIPLPPIPLRPASQRKVEGKDFPVLVH